MSGDAYDPLDVLEFELYVADDEDTQVLAERMARIGLDAVDDFDLAAELFAFVPQLADQSCAAPPELVCSAL
ncbi:hypothetical protein MOQ72_43655 [Saccharopolyspora sp. K220]|uniref:hypothetical protein n=1 Tax=Saccharopolyspora soli TaxID=2926618 RepID=UPI001F59DF83|nr:hypothetical protein [Saccharopolyspora soli]MCI2424311.1 hypothetical protein [Saccharopolyspora soli]